MQIALACLPIRLLVVEFFENGFLLAYKRHVTPIGNILETVPLLTLYFVHLNNVLATQARIFTCKYKGKGVLGMVKGTSIA